MHCCRLPKSRLDAAISLLSQLYHYYGVGRILKTSGVNYSEISGNNEENEMRYPEFLRKNGKIGFIAPSFGAVIEPYHSLFDSALKQFKRMGYETVLGPNCYKDVGIGKSNTPMECGKEINDFFKNDKCDIIISCGGGETMCEDLPYVDFAAIRASKPKWYIGYSDNTNLTFTLPVLCDTAAVYGPNAASFGMMPWHKSLEDTFGILKGELAVINNYEKWERESDRSADILAPYNVTEPFESHVFIGETETDEEVMVSGRLIGGCLDCLAVLCGTAFDKTAEFCEKYKTDGIIWFFEACELTPTGVRRVLWQLENSGWFKFVKGFLVGRPMNMDADGMGFDRFSAVTGILGKYNVPVIMDADLGHLPPMMPIISGACADIKAVNNSLSISYRYS